MKSEAIQMFDTLEIGILNIIKAADLFTIHLLAKGRNERPSEEVIDNILSKLTISGYNWDSWVYRDGELKMLEEKGHFKQIGEQILLATYTAMEIYMIEKFKECYLLKLNHKDTLFAQSTLKRVSFRGVDEIKDNFKDFLALKIAQFEIEYYSDQLSHFQPATSWEAIQLIATARNEIAHSGTSTSYKISSPLDSWYPFDFVRRWVSAFDANVDLYFYEGRETEGFSKCKL